jgi:histone deacetylase 6
MSTKVYLAYDERMTLHQPLPESSIFVPEAFGPAVWSDANEKSEGDQVVEVPNRIRAIYKKLMDLETRDGHRRFLEVPCLPASRDTIALVHSAAHYDYMLGTMSMSDDELRSITDPCDLYFCKDTFSAARLAVGGVVECVDAVLDKTTRKSRRAVAIVRPPGHHATRDKAMGTYARQRLNFVFQISLTILVILSQAFATSITSP